MVDGKAKEFLEGDYGVRGNAYFIGRTIETNIETGNLPNSNFHRFLQDFHEVGKTPYIPIFKKKEDKTIELKGVGFFSLGKIVHRINMEDAFFFKLLVDEYNGGWHDVEIEGSKASIQSIKGTHKFHLTNTSPYEVTVDIKLKGVVNEYTGKRINRDIFKKLEKKMEKEISEESLKLIEKFKELDIDPVGFGSFVRSVDREFDYKKWSEKGYKELIVKVNANVENEEVGIIE